MNPDEVVAMGAAIQAGVLRGDVKERSLMHYVAARMGCIQYFYFNIFLRCMRPAISFPGYIAVRRYPIESRHRDPRGSVHPPYSPEYDYSHEEEPGIFHRRR